MNIETLFNNLSKGKDKRSDFYDCSAASTIPMESLLNELSLLFARKFMDGQVSYEDADDGMNGVWCMMIHHISKNKVDIVEPCYSIYCAFDEGEYDHKDGKDPVESYTKPMLVKILNR